MFNSYQRRKSIAVQIGQVGIGGDNPIRIQSMTDTETSNVEKTVEQIIQLARAGSELVRITVNTEAAAAAVPEIRQQLLKRRCDVPVIGDFHYNGHRLLSEYPECARALDKYRINPGNVGFGNKRDIQFAQMIDIAIQYDKPVRIGVNWGSLDQAVLAALMDENARLAQPKDARLVLHDALIHSAIRSAQYAEKLGLPKHKIILAVKVSEVNDLIAIYRSLAQQCDYALHLGLTEAGMGTKGIVATTAALSTLLLEGIGDTIRCSLTPEPGASREKEVQVCQEILQSLSLRAFVPSVSACPGCGRTTSTYFRELAEKVQGYVRNMIPVWSQRYEGVESMKLAVMGCVVNGPGESKHANIGISLPGSGEAPVAPVFADGKKIATLRGEHIAESFYEIVNEYVAATYPAKETVSTE